MKCPDITAPKKDSKYTFVYEPSSNHNIVAVLWLWPSSKRTCYIRATCPMHFCMNIIKTGCDLTKCTDITTAYFYVNLSSVGHVA